MLTFRWEHDALLTLLLALVVGWVALMYRYWQKGCPFGSRAAARRAVTVIAVTALLATVLSVLLPHWPVPIGALIPALLCADRLTRGGQEEPRLDPQWYAVATLGITLMLGWLETQIGDDRESFCESKMLPEGASLDQIADAADRLHATLGRRVSSTVITDKLNDDYDAVRGAVAAARHARLVGDAEESRRNHHVARTALFIMLGRAYNCGITNIAMTPSPTALISGPT